MATKRSCNVSQIIYRGLIHTIKNIVSGEEYEKLNNVQNKGAEDALRRICRL